MKKIASAEALPEHMLQLEYVSGESIQVDFTPLINQGGVFAVLEDEDFFQQVIVDEYGRYIEWPGGLDFCADALFKRAGSVV